MSENLKHIEKLATILEGKTEVSFECGNIDILTEGEIVEVKTNINWKTGIGNLIVSKLYFPNHTPILYLFGDISDKRKATIEKTCSDLGISVMWLVNDDSTIKNLDLYNVIAPLLRGRSNAKPISWLGDKLSFVLDLPEAITTKRDNQGQKVLIALRGFGINLSRYSTKLIGEPIWLYYLDN